MKTIFLITWIDGWHSEYCPKAFLSRERAEEYMRQPENKRENEWTDPEIEAIVIVK